MGLKNRCNDHLFPNRHSGWVQAPWARQPPLSFVQAVFVMAPQAFLRAGCYFHCFDS